MPLTVETRPPMPAGEPRPSSPDVLDISVVMPCLNEERTVGECVARVRRWLAQGSLNGEVIVVDNGSSDRSRRTAEEAGAVVVDEPRRGYGHAYLAGFAAARGYVIVMGDSDGTYDFSNLDPLIAPLSSGYDMVVGNRFEGGIEPGAMPILHRHLGTPILSRVLKVVTGTPVGDSQSGFRAITRPALDRLALKSTGMELASEMILKAERHDLRVTEVPIGYAPRIGESKLRTFSDGWRHLRYLLLNTPTYTFILPGLLFCLVGIASLAMALVVNGVTIDSAGGQLGLVGTVFIVLGVMGFLFGVQAWGFSLRRGLVSANGPIHAYRRFMTVERAFLVAALLIVAGLVIDLFILVEITRDRRFVPARLAVAFLAQSIIIIGAGLVWSTLLGHMIDAHDEL